MESIAVHWLVASNTFHRTILS